MANPPLSIPVTCMGEDCSNQLSKIQQYKHQKYCSPDCYHEAQIGVKRKLSKKQRERFSEVKMSEKNPMWRGDNVCITGLHEWVRRHKPKPKYCVDCELEQPRDLANISGEYKRDINDFEWLCRRCHMKKDGRLKKLIKNAKEWRINHA